MSYTYLEMFRYFEKQANKYKKAFEIAEDYFLKWGPKDKDIRGSYWKDLKEIGVDKV